jgi:hypothetical protein
MKPSFAMTCLPIRLIAKSNLDLLIGVEELVELLDPALHAHFVLHDLKFQLTKQAH